MNIETGWYVPTKSAKRPRWVLAVSETHVLYGSGGAHIVSASARPLPDGSRA